MNTDLVDINSSVVEMNTDLVDINRNVVEMNTDLVDINRNVVEMNTDLVDINRMLLISTPILSISTTCSERGPCDERVRQRRRKRALRSLPGVDVHVGPGAQLRGPGFDLRLQASGLEQGADLFAHLIEGRDGQTTLPALLAPGAAVVGVDLVVGDEDQGEEALLNVSLDLELAFDQR